MYRLLLRLTSLGVVLGLGLFAIAHAQRGPQSAAAQQPAIERAEATNQATRLRAASGAGTTGNSNNIAFAQNNAPEIPDAGDVFSALAPAAAAQPAAASSTAAPRQPGYLPARDALAEAAGQMPPEQPLSAAPPPQSAGNSLAFPAPANDAPRPLSMPAAYPETASSRSAVTSTLVEPRANDALAPPAALPSGQPQPLPDHSTQPAPPPRSTPATQPIQPRSARPATSQAERSNHQHLIGPQTPAIEVEKLAPNEVQVGKPAIFETRLRNVGAVAAHEVTVRDELPDGADLVSTQPAATRGPRGELIWDIGTLKAGEEITVQVELMPKAEGELASTAQVYFAAQAAMRTIATRPELELAVEMPAEVLLGEELTMVARVTNIGTGMATGVVVTEEAPETLAHPAGQRLEYEVGELAPNESRELQLTLKGAQAGDAANLVTAHGDGQLFAEQRTNVSVTAPELQVALDGPRRRYLDRQATYTVSVANPGTAPANEVQLVTYLPDGMQFVDANNAGQYDPQTHSVHWLLEELPPRQQGSVMVTTLPVEAGEHELRVESSAQRGLTAEARDTVLVEGVAALLFQVADLSDPVEVGGETTYEIKVVNQGSKVATNVTLVAVLPAEMKALAAEGPTRYDLSGSQVRFQPLPKLAPKEETVYQVRVQGTAPGDLRFRVQLTSDDARTPITKEESTRVYSDQ